MSFLQKCKDLIARFFTFIFTAKNWATKKRLWIGAIIFLRFLFQFCREYGLTLGKKSLKGEHIFLTGAGSGIGRMMAIRFGHMGAKLSISDINLAGVEETKNLMVKEGVPAENIHTFMLDVSKRVAITEAAQ